MGGKLKVKSEFQKGSTFTFKVFLSLAEELKYLTTSEVEKPPEEKIGDKRILIAEDNLVNQKILAIILSREGCKVKTVVNGREALEEVQHEPCDLILMDGQMPEMDGLEATRQIRKIYTSRALPIIGVTAHAMSSDRERFLESGMNGYLTKPIHKKALIDEIQRCLYGRGVG